MVQIVYHHRQVASALYVSPLLIVGGGTTYCMIAHSLPLSVTVTSGGLLSLYCGGATGAWPFMHVFHCSDSLCPAS